MRLGFVFMHATMSGESTKAIDQKKSGNYNSKSLRNLIQFSGGHGERTNDGRLIYYLQLQVLVMFNEMRNKHVLLPLVYHFN